MKRREFCKLMASSAAAAVLPATRAGALAGPSGFNRLDYTYAQFCAVPELERSFYALRSAGVVSEHLDPVTWKEAGYEGPAERTFPTGWWNGVPLRAPVPGLGGEGPFQPTWESLGQYECPEWYRDAKFGIWNHWSPQCVAEDGDWYARNVYVDDQPQYRYHLKHYGHPTRFGYKDLCAQWTLLNWQPEQLMDLYSRAGARLFVALANHHDGIDTWNSAHHPWNAVNVGPHRDVIGTWAKAARDRGMKFGVTVHQARNWWWFQVAHGADRSGAHADQAYDGRLTLADGRGQWWEGLDPQRLYGPKHPADALPDASYVKNFYDRTRDLIDQHDPDLLYFDDALLPLGWAGMSIGAYFYNRRLTRAAQSAQGGCCGHRTRTEQRHSAPPVAVGNLHRRMALSASPVRTGGRIWRLPASSRCHSLDGRHRQQERHLHPQHSGPTGRNDRFQRGQNPRGDRRVDEAERRGDLRHSTVEGLR
jgi:alpha-L-fucosidase